jgi:hypothetical protein
MIAILTTLFGFFSGLLPSLVKILELRVQKNYELEIVRLQLEAAKANVELTSVVDEGKSLRQHDAAITVSGPMETLRASIRPVLTYSFFTLFCVVKMIAASFMLSHGYDAIQTLNAVWDVYTMAIFGSIMGFWFGSRAISKMNDQIIANQYTATKSLQK